MNALIRNLFVLCCMPLVLVGLGCSDPNNSDSQTHAATTGVDSIVETTKPTASDATAMMSSARDSVVPNQQQSVNSAINTASGDVLFSHYCGHCHNPGEGHPGTMRLGIRLAPEHAVLRQRDNLSPAYIKQIVRNGLGMMPPFRPTEISDMELESLASYVANH